MTKINFKDSTINIDKSENIEIGNVKEHDKLGDKVLAEVSVLPNYVKVIVVVAIIIVAAVIYSTQT